MIHPNPFFEELQPNYLFRDIADRVDRYLESHSGASIIKMGIGDVTRPIPHVCAVAMHGAIDEMATKAIGYDPGLGHDFLREAIARQYRDLGIHDEDICIVPGAKYGMYNLLQILDHDGIRVAIPDPVYPAYLEANILTGHRSITYLPCTPDNCFQPEPPDQFTHPLDLIYLCSPNNPTGAVMSFESLNNWVYFAKSVGAVILFDAAYAAFIRNRSLPRSIYEIPGARSVAVEIGSFSKLAGFTCMPCGWTVVPKELTIRSRTLSDLSHLQRLHHRQQSMAQNGVPYPVQRAAEAALTREGKKECRQVIGDYLKNAELICKTFLNLGYGVIGGQNAPYVWVQITGTSWGFFNRLLLDANVVVTPGVGFGSEGKNYVRISAFNDHDTVVEAMARIKAIHA